MSAFGSLTPAQQSVVAHNQGPALVFAAAGSGKTTTMVARIARLVQDDVFAAEQILATSFNRAAADAIERALRGRGVKSVHVKTLHAFGYQLVGEACQRGLLKADLERSRRSFESLDRQLLNRTLVEARRTRTIDAAQLNALDLDDFLDYLARCKGNLIYADLVGAQLPAAAQKIASQAQSPADKPIYLPLYRLYEETRRRLGWITYDDMLMVGWEVLVRHREILQAVQKQIRCILVDEFQDVNLAQVEIIDRISQPHRNLMVIGDDDQTIYEWRGAAARFILEFQDRYRARVYVLQENFRCTASQVALANAVIEQNVERSPKQLKLTQGFDGETALRTHADERTMGEAIAAELANLNAPPQDVAILLRLFVQSAPMEVALLRAGIPYTVEGDLPFYRRPEVTALLDYLRLGQMEAQLLAGKSLSIEQAERFRQLWPNVANRPLRYIARSWIDQCADSVIQRGEPLSTALQTSAQGAPSGVAERMHHLAADLRWLAQRMASQGTAHRLLLELEGRLGYREALAKEGGGEELGRARTAMVHAFIELAEDRGGVNAFLAHLEKMEIASGKRRSAVTITTIFRAKGLEWPIVIVPGCNEGMLPYERGSNPFEERRLLYVAITRARQRLFLHALQSRPLSSFLVEAQIREVLTTVETVRRTLATPSNRWSDQDALLVAVAGKRLGLDEYLLHWWQNAQRDAVIARIGDMLTQLSAQGRLAALGLIPEDVRFWQGKPVTPQKRVTPRQVDASAPQQAQWSRTRRNSQAMRDSVGRFFLSLRELLKGKTGIL
ncbi:MAG: ATP-dependent helicase [Caldilineaceae bacterium]|nr:ATP-dependent helicase [Caldilineaceae bacterium]